MLTAAQGIHNASFQVMHDIFQRIVANPWRGHSYIPPHQKRSLFAVPKRSFLTLLCVQTRNRPTRSQTESRRCQSRAFLCPSSVVVCFLILRCRLFWPSRRRFSKVSAGRCFRISRFLAHVVDRTHHSQHTSVKYSLFTSAERTPRVWLKSHGLQCRLCAPEKNLSSGVAHVSPFVVLSTAVYHGHIIFFIHSSFYHDTRTRSTIGSIWSPQRTHPVHHEHLQALPADRQRHQESLRREDLQSGGNPRTTTPTHARDGADNFFGLKPCTRGASVATLRRARLLVHWMQPRQHVFKVHSHSGIPVAFWGKGHRNSAFPAHCQLHTGETPSLRRGDARLFLFFSRSVLWRRLSNDFFWKELLASAGKQEFNLLDAWTTLTLIQRPDLIMS